MFNRNEYIELLIVCRIESANTKRGVLGLTFPVVSMSQLVGLKGWAVDVLVLAEIGDVIG